METINKIIKYLREDHLRNCRKCGKLELRRFFGIDHRNRSIWIGSENGNKWHGAMCPKCSEVQRSRLKGHKSIDEISGCSSAEGRRCEILAKKYFESFGLTAELNNVSGPDLRLFLGNKEFATCEVKKVTQSKWLNHEKWRVSPVRNNRKHDDLICYVFNDGFYVTKMKKHISQCSRGGSRSIKVEERESLRGIRL